VSACRRWAAKGDNLAPQCRDQKAKPREDLSAVAGLYSSETVCRAVTSSAHLGFVPRLSGNVQQSVNAELKPRESRGTLALAFSSSC